MFRKTTEVEILTWLQITYKVKLNLITIYQRKSICYYFLFQKNITFVSILGWYCSKEVTQNSHLLTSQKKSRRCTQRLPSLRFTTLLWRSSHFRLSLILYLSYRSYQKLHHTVMVKLKT